MNTELGRDLSPAASDGQGRDNNRERSAWSLLSRMPRPQRHPAVIHCILSVRSPSTFHPTFAELDARLARLEALIVQDEEFHRETVDALRAVARRPDRPVD